MSGWISFKALYLTKQVRSFPTDPGCEMLLSPTSQKSRRIRQLLILLCFYFNITCSKKKKLTEFISIYNAYKEKGLQKQFSSDLRNCSN